MTYSILNPNVKSTLLKIFDKYNISYYFPFLLWAIIILYMLHYLKKYYKKQNEESKAPEDKGEDTTEFIDFEVSMRAKGLKSRYLKGFILSYLSISIMTPYLYTLFKTVHKFFFAEIGLLYLIDIFSTHFFRLFICELAGKIGRRKFLIIFNSSVIINSLLKIKGSRSLVYLSQFISGFSKSIIYIVFNEWIISESKRTTR